MKKKLALAMAVFMSVSSIPQGIVLNVAAEEMTQEAADWTSEQTGVTETQLSESEEGVTAEESNPESESMDESAQFFDDFTSELDDFSGNGEVLEPDTGTGAENRIFPEESQITKMELEKSYEVQNDNGESVWFSFEPEESGTYVFASQGEWDTFGALYDVEERQLAMNDDGESGYNFQISYELEGGMRYYLETSLTDEKSGNYTVSVEKSVEERKETSEDIKTQEDKLAETVSETEAGSGATDTIRSADSESEEDPYGIKNVEVFLKSKYYTSIDRITPSEILLNINYNNGSNYLRYAAYTDRWGNYFRVKIQLNDPDDIEDGNHYGIDDNGILTGSGISLKKAGNYTIQIYLNDTDRVVGEAVIQLIDMSTQPKKEIKEGEAFEITEDSELFSFTPAKDGYYYLSEAPEHTREDIIFSEYNDSRELQSSYLTAGSSYTFWYEGKPGTAVIESVPELESISWKNEEEAIEDCTSAADIAAWDLIGQYSNGKSYDIKENAWGEYVDYWGKPVEKRVLDAEGKSVSGKLIAGDYTLEVTGNTDSDKTVTMPVHVKTLAEAAVSLEEHALIETKSNGWAIFQYQPDEDSSYFFSSPCQIKQVIGKDANGNILEIKAYNAYEQYGNTGNDGYLVSMKKGMTYYLAMACARTYLPVNVQKISQKEIQSTVLSSSRNYYTKLDRMTPNDFYLDIFYTDGTSERVENGRTTSSGSRLQIEIENKQNSPVLSGGGIQLGEAGEVLVKAYLEGNTEAVAQLQVQVNALDTDLLEKVQAGVKFHAEENGELFYFQPEKTGTYYFTGIADSDEVMLYEQDAENDVWSAKNLKSSNVLLKADGSYIIRYTGNKAADLTICERVQTTTPGFEMEADKTYENLQIGKFGDKVKLSFTPEQSGIYQLEVIPNDESTLRISMAGMDVSYLNSYTIRHILKEGETCPITIECAEDFGIGSQSFSARIRYLKEKSADPVSSIDFSFFVSEQTGLEGFDKVENMLPAAYFYYDESDNFNEIGYYQRCKLGENTDSYGNPFTVTLEDVSKDPEVKKEYKYRITCGSTSAEKDIVLYNPEKLESLLPGEEKEISLLGERQEERFCYRFTPDKDGEYMIDVNPMDNLRAFSIEVYGEDGKSVEGKNWDSAYLTAGKTYYIMLCGNSLVAENGTVKVELENPDSGETTEKAKVIDLELVKDMDDSYAVYGMAEPDCSGAAVKLVYSDGTSKEAVLGQLSSARYYVDSKVYWAGDKASYMVEYSYGDFRVKKQYDAVRKSDLPVISGTETTSVDFGNGMHKRIVKIQPEEDGEYVISLKSEGGYSYYFADAKGNQIVSTDEKTALKKGKQYYAVISSSGIGEVSLLNADEIHVHDYVWVIDKEATCGEAGSQHEECSVCHEKKEAVEIPATGKHSYEMIVDTEATCGTAGKEHEECSVCHDKKEAVEIPATGKHSYEMIVDTEATCGSAGKGHEECSVCHDKKEPVEIPATGKHSYKLVVDTAATCGTAGKQHEECSVCHAKKNAVEIPATNAHKFTEYKITKEPTISENGIQERECTICGKKENAVVEKIPATIAVSAKKVTVAVGKSIAAPTVTFANGDSIASWKSAKTSVATVNKNGKITGKKAGKTTITVTLKSKKTAKITVVVAKKIPTTSLKADKKSLQLKKGKSYQLKVTVKPINTTDKLSFKSSNTKIVTVSSKGKLKAKKKGKATITITSGKKKVTCKVTVK